MKRLHVHLSVDDLDGALRFYRALFGADAHRPDADTAEWVLDDPALSFVVNRRTGAEASLVRLGLAVPDAAAMDALRARFGRPTAAAGADAAGSELLVDPVDVLWEVHAETRPRLVPNQSRAAYVQARQDRDERHAADWAYGWRSAVRRRRGRYAPRPFGSIG